MLITCRSERFIVCILELPPPYLVKIYFDFYSWCASLRCTTLKCSQGEFIYYINVQCKACRTL